ncbi:hypothetical protein A2693_02205 [Candidatus Curtissbacteria bacterium RIFCSPHIGHO2_01_FULL_40_12]|uniref:PEGA domain-containing protein n=1 Tax=Candidatus Curtissbacteria bacterium RIFCSPHIGHO2_01_FULL_40_12 TaxID=1797710 RepID=A0A1F5GAF8_9BACT|nr:MAG: hypothetical protein A2693_02205 [Candidatus Curtissbacteria bacterium RIFCSPHIGHO2_01_FULL_40_12]
MKVLAKNRVAFSIIIAALILIFGTVAIFWARGFKLNFKDRTIDRTGLLVASSVPTGAEIYLDDRLTSATDTNIAYLEPKIYKIRIQKDGFTTWEKDIDIRADLATEIKALLFPLAPEIKPLTTTGAANPVLSPDGTKIVYGTSGDRGGLHLMTLSDRPIPFRSDLRLLVKNSSGFDFTKSLFIWSPDSKQVIARFEQEDGSVLANLLIDNTDKSDQDPGDITGSLAATLNSWQEELIAKAQTQAVSAPDAVKNATAEAKIVGSSESVVSSPTTQPASPAKRGELPTTNYQLNYYPTGLIFSPDEEKILYKNKEGQFKVYDLKNKREVSLPNFADFINISWFPDSSHLVVAQKDLISIIEADGANKMTVFSGKFENGFVFGHPSGTRIIILTTLTQTEGNPANLYAVNLR